MKNAIKVALLLMGASLMSMTMGNLPDMYMVNKSTSTIKWKATNGDEKTNTGGVSFKSGNIKVDTKQIVGGFMYVNMQTLNCNSISDAGFNKALVDEMRSADVMNAVKYKEMTFKVVKAIRKDVAEGKPNYDITLQVGLKGLKKNVTFPAVVGLSKKSTSVKGGFTLSKEEFTLPYDIEIDLNINTALKK